MKRTSAAGTAELIMNIALESGGPARRRIFDAKAAAIAVAVHAG